MLVNLHLLAYRAARERRFREHQAWMIRNFALTYAAVTLRAALPVLILLQLPFSIVVAEILISRRGLPGVRMSTL
ncbi:hypothetical protein Aple_028520 [Acrocarpospora pleiomorpha]|uniref:Uncharacterized protein n=1 Tax=Acrocarpospora pleiomorpha TaxID=90975 RepID=A0A5M3XH14_9ACTN|nr:DUF2306 domain-containing protein [Acrocarpospora pleiomorpha]GES19956.1 hypothetical protein Aple_028520 [Acrocarpospora pleiomorpha]